MNGKSRKSADLLSVSGLAAAVGVSPSYIRKLEAKGLAPLRSEQGYRLYLPGSIEKARGLVKRLNRRRRRRTLAS
jgi:DNA-binding transcriptional MerR regulator